MHSLKKIYRAQAIHPCTSLQFCDLVCHLQGHAGRGCGRAGQGGGSVCARQLWTRDSGVVVQGLLKNSSASSHGEARGGRGHATKQKASNHA